MLKQRAIAHVLRKEDGSWAEPHWLNDHLAMTAELSQKFAQSFESGSWARACAAGHDSAKSRQAWQEYLKGKSGYYDPEAHLENIPGKMDHSTPSARLSALGIIAPSVYAETFYSQRRIA